MRALVGGFDYAKSKFNHVTQAWRQPGSSFKPFIYSAALEKGFTPATVVNDAPLFFDAGTTGSQPWEPKNYDGKFEGPMSLRRGAGEVEEHGRRSASCSRSAPPYAQDWITRFGFEADKHPAYLHDGAGRRLGHAAADGRGLRACSPTAATDVNPVLDQQAHRHQGPCADRGAPPALDESTACDRRAQRLRDGQPAAGGDARRHRRRRAGDAEAPRRLRQDRHDQRLDGRLVLPASSQTWSAIVWIGYDNAAQARATARPAAACRCRCGSTT